VEAMLTDAKAKNETTTNGGASLSTANIFHFVHKRPKQDKTDGTSKQSF